MIDFKVSSASVSTEEAVKFADELELVIGEICNKKRKPQNIPMEPMVALIQFARNTAAIAAAEQAQQAEPVAQCPNCLGTKQPHALDPEWKGKCECAAQPPAVVNHGAIWAYRRYGSEPEKGYTIVSRPTGAMHGGTPIAYLGDGDLAEAAVEAICKAHNSAQPPAVAVPDSWHAAMSFARSALAEAIQIAPLDRLPRMAGAAMQQIDALLAAMEQPK